MKWIKASERLPELAYEVCIKLDGLNCSGAFFYTEFKRTVSIRGFDDMGESYFPRIAWLDEDATPEAENQDEWVEVKDGNLLPDYDEPVLWLYEDGNMFVEALDKDGNPWLFGHEWVGETLPKATHWRYLPNPPSQGNS